MKKAKLKKKLRDIEYDLAECNMTKRQLVKRVADLESRVAWLEQRWAEDSIAEQKSAWVPTHRCKEDGSTIRLVRGVIPSPHLDASNWAWVENENGDQFTVDLRGWEAIPDGPPEPDNDPDYALGA